MLALAALVIAFANPYFPSAINAADTGNYAALYVDNSPSMQSGEDQNSLLIQARNQAVDIIKGLPENYRVQVLTNDFQGRQQRYYNKQQAIDMVDAILPSYAFRKSEEIVNKLKLAQEKEGNSGLEVFWLSDFQKTAFTKDIEAPEQWQQTIIPFRTPQNLGNIAIDSAWFERPILQPGFDQELKIQLSNSGSEENRKVSINLSLDGQLQGAKEVEIIAGAKTTTSFTLRVSEAKAYKGEIAVDAGNPYFDNTFYFSYSVDRPFNILLTGDDEFRTKFEKLFADSIYKLNYNELDRIDYSTLSQYDLILLDAPESVPSGFIQALRENLNAGKTVVLIPAAKNAEAINNVLANLRLPPLGEKRPAVEALDIIYKDPHFKGVFSNTPEKPSLPKVDEYYQYSSAVGYPLLTLADGNPMVSRIPVASGTLLLVTANLANTNFASHPIFVPIMLNAALFSRTSTALYTLSGKAQGPEFMVEPSGESPLSITANGQELIPRQRNRNQTIELYDLPTELKPGIYDVTREGKPQGFLALNPAPAESRWSFLSDEEITRQFGPESTTILQADATELGYTISQRYNGTSLWKWFLVAALLFLVIEIVLIKLWK